MGFCPVGFCPVGFCPDTPVMTSLILLWNFVLYVICRCNNVLVKYGSHRTLSVSFVKVDINKWDLCCTADVQSSPTTHIKRKTGTRGKLFRC